MIVIIKRIHPYLGKVVYPKKLPIDLLDYLSIRLFGYRIKTPYKVVWIPRNMISRYG
jgi:hypothetical protein